MLRTALYDWHQSHGGRMVEFAGWNMPIQYSSIVDEHQAVRQRAGLFDIGHMGRLWFSGPEHLALLERFLTNSVATLKDGQVRYSLVCKEDGGIVDDVLVTRFEQGALLVVNGANRENIVSWFQKHQGTENAAMLDRTLNSAMIALQGPEAERILAPNTDLDLSQIKYYYSGKGTAFGVPAVISRTGYTGEDGFELIFDQEHAVDVWSKIMQAGESVNILPCGLGCRDTLRLEAGMPLYGHEMDETIDPFRAGLGFAVKFNKPDFIGKPALEKISQQSDLPHRVGLKLEGKRIARQGSEVYFNDEKVGVVTSGTFSPTLQQSLAMASVSQNLQDPGTTVEIDIRGKREPATLVALPFYKRKK